MHSYEKGRAGVGLVSTVWVTGTEPAHSAITSHSLQVPPCNALLYLGYNGAAGVALEDRSGLRSTTFLHLVVFSIQGFDRESLGLVSSFGDWFMLGTRTLHEGGVMICWLGRLGHYVGASDHAIFCFPCDVCFGCVLRHLIVTLQLHLHLHDYIEVVMHCNDSFSSPVRLLCVH